MYSVINHIRVVPEHREAFEERFRANLVHMEGVEGFIQVQVWRPSPAMKEEGAYPHEAYMVQTDWVDAAAFRAWIGSPSFRASHAEPMPEAWRAGPAMMSQHVLAFEQSSSPS
ncbi:MAG: antibiotic biosynthesis monooxygenase family protein [Myxococcota bacterium]